MLAYKVDLYGGVLIDPAGVPSDPQHFRSALGASLQLWTQEGRNGVWLKLGIELAVLIPIATSEFGFRYHHAEPTYVMLNKWLPTSRPSTLPPNASHTIGVGALVMDEAGRVLMLRERAGPAASLGIWKLPTGLVEAGEEIHEAAVREVREETGVEAVFDSVAGFWSSHYAYNTAHPGKSSLYFVVRCRAKTTEITIQESEIAEAKWFTLEEKRKLPYPQKGSAVDVLDSIALSGADALEAKRLQIRMGAVWTYTAALRASL